MEIYNENIRDLLVANSSENLDLREDPEKGPTVAGIHEIEASSASHVMSLLHRGNKRRTQEATAANAVSSRSHAVLQVIVEQHEKSPGTASRIKVKKPWSQYFLMIMILTNTQYGKLSMIDLAGSERAAVTKNRGQQYELAPAYSTS